MDRRSCLTVLATLVFSSRVTVVAGAPRVVVIAHEDNPVTHLGAGELEAIFGTRRLYWPAGKRIVPFNFPAKHARRVAFDRAVLHLGPDEVARYWIDRRVRGGHPPPRQVPDVHTMLRVVAALEGAVGYVHSDEVKGPIKVVAEL